MRLGRGSFGLLLVAFRVAPSAAAPPDLRYVPPAAARAEAEATGPATVDRADGVTIGEYKLRRVAGGGFVYDDSRYVAHVGLDGAVRFDDKRLRRNLPLAELLDIPPGGFRDRDVREHMSTYHADPSVHDRTERTDPFYQKGSAEPWADRPYRGTQPADVIGALLPRFLFPVYRGDATDELMRAMGRDPYAYEKAKFLAATMEMRVRMAFERRRYLLRESIRELPGRLRELWGDTRFTTMERFAILGLLREECDQDEPAGRQAHAIIDAFIRARAAEVPPPEKPPPVMSPAASSEPSGIAAPPPGKADPRPRR